MGLKGSKSMFIFFSLPSSVITVPVYTTRPLGGTCGTDSDAGQRTAMWVGQRSATACPRVNNPTCTPPPAIGGACGMQRQVQN